MDPHQRSPGSPELAAHQRNEFLVAPVTPETEDPKSTKAGRQIGLCR
jgi:hypothetical protein